MAKGSRGGKRKGGAASNAKYNGFSITDKKGNTTHYKVINGKVESAVAADGIHNTLKGIGKNPIQAAYDKYGSVNGVIKHVNKIGKAKASVLSDKAVEKMNSDYLKKRGEFSDSLGPRNSKKGINKHSLYWNAM